ncbi:MAG: tetratricopeptide repeat protein [Caldilineales bacterium]|nr:tetratricopeptide repeat protein [Caldilineales bacterium]
MIKRVHLFIVLAIMLVLLAACGGGSDSATTPAADTPAAAPSGDPAECSSVDSCFAAGNQAANAVDLGAALEAYKKGLTINPNHAPTLSNLGVVYYQMGQLSDAKAQFEKALAINPNDAATHYLLGATLLQENNLVAAEEALTKALQIDPTLPEARFGMGMLRRMQGRVEEAIQEFEMFLAGPSAQDPRAKTEAETILKQLRGE